MCVAPAQRDQIRHQVKSSRCSGNSRGRVWRISSFGIELKGKLREKIREGGFDHPRPEGASLSNPPFTFLGVCRIESVERCLSPKKAVSTPRKSASSWLCAPNEYSLPFRPRWFHRSAYLFQPCRPLSVRHLSHRPRHFALCPRLASPRLVLLPLCFPSIRRPDSQRDRKHP